MPAPKVRRKPAARQRAAAANVKRGKTKTALRNWRSGGRTTTPTRTTSKPKRQSSVVSPIPMQISLFDKINQRIQQAIREGR